jgi:hypothetical protein
LAASEFPEEGKMRRKNGRKISFLREIKALCNERAFFLHGVVGLEEL